MITSYIYNTFNGVDQAYIYIWVSKQHQAVYIGMTNRYSGTIGRADGHFNRNGTFRKKILRKKGYSIENIHDLILLSFPLPKKREYISEERSYREAVEYLIYKELLLQRTSVNPSFDVVAWVRDSPVRTNNSEVKKIALNIIDAFLSNYEDL